MKILFLCKRRPMCRDLLTRPYGRFFHLPRLLAARGHEVTLLLLSYKCDRPQSLVRDGVTMISVGQLPLGPFSYVRLANRLAKEQRPDWVVGFSDTYFGILAHEVANNCGARSLIDAYDNYESYLPWCSPLHYLWRRALGRATVVSAAGPQLADLLKLSRSGGEVVILPMAADPDFFPLDQNESRKELGLPLQKKLIGYCGSIYRNRGVEFLFQLTDQIRTIVPGAEVIVSGRQEKGLVIPSSIRCLGYLPDRRMPALLNSMDVLLVINRDSSFGQFSYPVKLYEAMQCRVPVVASGTAPARWILDGNQRFLANVGDLEGFSDKIIAALDNGKPLYQSSTSWENVAEELEKTLK